MSRFSTYKPLDKCAHPLVVWHNGRKYVVPCGSCDCCRLSRANDWSFRLGDEITSSPFSIWFTLTYNNKYLPKLKIVPSIDGDIRLVRDSLDIRFDSVKDKLRDDDFDFQDLVMLREDFERMPIQNFGDDTYLAYSSKKDIQLFLKNIRQNLYEKFGYRVPIRYYIISEYGPRTYRPHCHGLIFTQSKEVTDYLINGCLFENWKMSDKSLFDQYVRLTSGGVENYVTDYVTGASRLPKIYQCRSFRPFRLSSKGPAIGFGRFCPQKLYEDVRIGTLEYTKSVPSIDKQYIFRYPKSYCDRLFPKCYEYAVRSSHALLSAYRLLYVLDRCKKQGYDYFCLFDGFFSNIRPLDLYAAQRCLYFCDYFSEHKSYLIEPTPSYFVYLVERYNFLSDMSALRSWYQWQIANADKSLTIFRSYQNVGDYLVRYSHLDSYSQYVFDSFTSSFGLDWSSIQHFKPSDFLVGDDTELHNMYVQDCEFIVSQMDKAKKLNEESNNSHLIY